jgi:hypothetical protein
MANTSTFAALNNSGELEESRDDPNVKPSVANQAESLKDKIHEW